MTTTTPPLRCLCVDGGIGLGKSTLIRRIQDTPEVVEAVLGAGKRVVTVLEPIDAWQASGLFELMCEDPADWAYPFQHDAMVTRIARWTHIYRQHAADPSVVFLLERAPQADQCVFTAVQAEYGHIDAEGIKEHADWWRRMWDKRPCEIDRVGVLQAPFATARRRIRERCRSGEEKYDWRYLERIHSRYEHFHERWPARKAATTLDATAPFHECNQALAHTLAQLAGCTEPETRVECACRRCK